MTKLIVAFRKFANAPKYRRHGFICRENIYYQITSPTYVPCHHLQPSGYCTYRARFTIKTLQFIHTVYLQYTSGTKSVVGIQTRHGLEGPGIEFRQRNQIFLFSQTTTPALSPHSLIFNGYRRSFPEVKRPKSEADHSPPSSAEGKNKWSHILLSAWHQGADSDNCNFTSVQLL